jgi:hypothetical protein
VRSPPDKAYSFAADLGTMMLYFIAVLFLLSPTAFADDRGNCFPGEAHHISAPSGTSEFIWEEPKDSTDAHHLLFRAEGVSGPQELLTFGRSLCIHWSPDEKYFAISDYMGSNVAEVYLFQSADTSRRVDVMDLLPADVRSYFRKGNSHGYLGTLAWNKAGLFVRAWGDREDAPRQYDVTLKCTVTKDHWLCSKVAANKRVHRSALTAGSR